MCTEGIYFFFFCYVYLFEAKSNAMGQRILLGAHKF